MNKIASFTVNHLDLLTGVYVSRKDYIGDVCLTTFDLRFTRPNEEPPMDTPGIHSIEHLVATFLRNHAEWAEKTILGRIHSFLVWVMEARTLPRSDFPVRATELVIV